MLIDADIIRYLLIFFMIGMAAFGLSYLSRRQLPFWKYIFFIAIILFLPIFGPFWVIAVQPGRRRPNVSPEPPRWFMWLNQRVNR